MGKLLGFFLSSCIFPVLFLWGFCGVFSLVFAYFTVGYIQFGSRKGKLFKARYMQKLTVRLLVEKALASVKARLCLSCSRVLCFTLLGIAVQCRPLLSFVKYTPPKRPFIRAILFPVFTKAIPLYNHRTHPIASEITFKRLESCVLF